MKIIGNITEVVDQQHFTSIIKSDIKQIVKIILIVIGMILISIGAYIIIKMK